MQEGFIRDLVPGDRVDKLPLLVQNRRLIPFTSHNREGQFFLQLTLGDVSGRINAVLWENADEIGPGIKEGDAVIATGSVSLYRDKKQITLEEIKVVPPESINAGRLVSTSPRDIKEMAAELKKIVAEEIIDPNLQALLTSFFSDNEFMDSFSRAPAARNIHHNWLGGLLQHSLEVASLCRVMADLCPGINRSLLLTGALLHDVGKLEEYNQDSLMFEFTTYGKLMGHIVIGSGMIQEKINHIPNFPPHLAMEILHMIVSHHGCREWGSPEVPKTMEAFTLFHADLTSGRLNQFYKLQQQAAAGGDEWSEYDRLLERNIYIPFGTLKG